MRAPTFGHTRHGHAVHARTIDHHPEGSAYARFNKRAAIFITEHVGTMTCAWLFCLIALASLPATLYAANVISLKTTLTSAGFILVVSWLAQSFIQLVLLPAIMVGQNLQAAASDARAAKQFEDTEFIVKQVDEHTDGGLKTVLDALSELHGDVVNGRSMPEPAREPPADG
jgi:hypothetical protein